MPGERGGVTLSETQLEHLLSKSVEAYKPFFDSVLRQMGAVEQRLVHQAEDVSDMKSTLAILTSQELKAQQLALECRLEILEGERQQRVGVTQAIKQAPSLLGWVVSLVAMILWYLKAKS